jgi:hypothetical protein
MRTLSLGYTGDDVGLLQQRLTRAGYVLEATHVYDGPTEAAIKAIQIKAGLVVDGLAGPKTYAAIFAGQRHPKHLIDADLARAADALGVPIACVRAVNEVESRGSGFLADGRAVILFERHVFWKRLRHRGIDPAPLALTYPEIVSQAFGGYKGGAAEHIRLASAGQINAGAAYESTSWGAFQVMGQHWQRLGYASIADFVSRMETSEGEHLDAFVRFVAADVGLLSALRAREWAAFAKGYNGPHYIRNRYDVKLAQAYLRYATKPARSDTRAVAQGRAT